MPIDFLKLYGLTKLIAWHVETCRESSRDVCDLAMNYVLHMIITANVELDGRVK